MNVATSCWIVRDAEHTQSQVHSECHRGPWDLMLVKWQPQSMPGPRDAGGPGIALSLLASIGHGILLASLRD